MCPRLARGWPVFRLCMCGFPQHHNWAEVHCKEIHSSECGAPFSLLLPPSLPPVFLLPFPNLNELEMVFRAAGMLGPSTEQLTALMLFEKLCGAATV